MLKNKVSGPQEKQASSTVDTPKKSPLEIVESIAGAVYVIKGSVQSYKERVELAKTVEEAKDLVQKIKECKLRSDRYMDTAVKVAENVMQIAEDEIFGHKIMVANQARQVIELAAEVACIAEEADRIAINAETATEATQLEADKLPITQEQTEELEKSPSAKKCTNTM